MEVHRGEVFYADLSPVVGSEQGGIRPVLIIQNEIGNRHSPTVIAAAAAGSTRPAKGCTTPPSSKRIWHSRPRCRCSRPWLSATH